MAEALLLGMLASVVQEVVTRLIERVKNVEGTDAVSAELKDFLKYINKNSSLGISSSNGAKKIIQDSLDEAKTELKKWERKNSGFFARSSDDRVKELRAIRGRVKTAISMATIKLVVDGNRKVILVDKHVLDAIRKIDSVEGKLDLLLRAQDLPQKQPPMLTDDGLKSPPSTSTKPPNSRPPRPMERDPQNDKKSDHKKFDHKKSDDKKSDDKKSDDKKSDDKKSDDKKSDDKKSDDKKLNDKKSDDKKSDDKKSDDKKSDDKKSDDKKSVHKKSDDKKSDHKKSDHKKSDDKKSDHKKSDNKKSDDKKSDDKKSDDKKSDDKKLNDKKSDDKKSDDKKSDDKKSDDKKSVHKKSDDKKSDHKKSDDKKSDHKKSDNKKSDDKKSDDKKSDDKKSDNKVEEKKQSVSSWQHLRAPMDSEKQANDIKERLESLKGVKEVHYDQPSHKVSVRLHEGSNIRFSALLEAAQLKDKEKPTAWEKHLS